MTLELLNCLLYCLTLLFYIFNKRNKANIVSVYTVIFAAYAIVSLLCALYRYDEPGKYANTTLLSYLFLYLCVVVSISPFKGFRLKASQVAEFKETQLIKVLTWIYVVTGVITLTMSLPTTIRLFQSGEWGVLRNDLYAGQVQLTSSSLEFLVKNIFGYLNPFGIIICLYQLSKPKPSKFLSTILLIVWVVNEFLAATLIASRSMVASLVFKFVVMAVLFRDVINVRVKRMLGVFGVLAAVFTIIYFSLVSVSRFGEEGAGSSVYFYLGHSMPAFNELIMGSMHDYAYGKYAFKPFIQYLGGNTTIDYKALGSKADGEFYTFVGDDYIDWGPVGTLLLVIFLTVFLRHFTKKKHLHLCDLTIILFFATYYLNGVFVVGEGFAWQLLWALIIYFIVKQAEH